VIAAAPGANAAPCSAADSLASELEQRLERSGVDSVNAYLVAHWDGAMLPLNQKVAACELQAVSLAIRLSRSADQRAVPAHVDSLRAASGQCARFVVATVMPDEIPRYCASIDAWSAARMARELRRRIADIDADPLLRSGPRGQACRAAYDHEFRNTRVTLRATSATPR
jgi:hypothetical protein